MNTSEVKEKLRRATRADKKAIPPQSFGDFAGILEYVRLR